VGAVSAASGQLGSRERSGKDIVGHVREVEVWNAARGHAWHRAPLDDLPHTLRQGVLEGKLVGSPWLTHNLL